MWPNKKRKKKKNQKNRVIMHDSKKKKNNNFSYNSCFPTSTDLFLSVPLSVVVCLDCCRVFIQFVTWQWSLVPSGQSSNARERQILQWRHYPAGNCNSSSGFLDPAAKFSSIESWYWTNLSGQTGIWTLCNFWVSRVQQAWAVKR